MRRRGRRHTVYPIQAGCFHKAASGLCKVVTQDGARSHQGECLTGSAAPNGQDHLQMVIFLLEMHQGPESPLNAVARRCGICPLIAKLPKQVSWNRQPWKMASEQTYKHPSVGHDVGKGIVNTVDAAVVE